MTRSLLAAWLFFAVASAAAGEVTDEELRRIGATQAQIDAMREADSHRPTTLQDYVALGSSAERELTIAITAPGGLELARDILLRTEMRDVTWPDYAAMNGLSNHTSEAVVDLLGEAAALHQPNADNHNLWTTTREAWTGAFQRLHGEDALERAREGAGDPALTPGRRALHLLVLRHARWVDGGVHRQVAVDSYRPYLQSDHPELRRSALQVAHGLWDFGARGDVEQLAFSGQDLKVRSIAYSLATVFCWYGPDPASLPKNAQGSIQAPIYDGEGLKRLLARKSEWKRENYRLRTGEEPPPSWPNQQVIERGEFQASAGAGEGRRALGSR